MNQNYINYLNFLEKELSKFFENQKEFILCKKGCSKCCRTGEYPFSETEIEYLKEGCESLDEKTKKVVNGNIENIIKEKKSYENNKFIYTCPFLVEESCSVYSHRGIICRTFGLIENGKNGEVKVPFCVNEGLNYSQILDVMTHQLSSELLEQKGFLNKPLGYNISYDFLTSEKFENKFNIKFGKKQTLIDWFI